MGQGDEDENNAGVTTPEMAVLTRLSNMYRVLFVGAFIMFVWVVATIAAIYFSFTGGAFVQALATNALASLLLIAGAPLIFEVLSQKPRPYFLVFVVVASGLIGAAAITTDGLRDFLLNFGCGLFFLLAVDYYVRRRFHNWLDRLDAATKEAIENIQPVL
jgi:hypothetical protein